MTISTHKRGDTFDYSDQFAMTIDGVDVTDFSGMTGASQLRYQSGALVATLEFTWLDAAQGLYRVRCPSETDDWALGVMKHDVQLTTASNDVVSTATELVNVVEDVTHG